MDTRQATQAPDETPPPIQLDRYIPALLNLVANRLTASGSATYRRRFGIGIMDFRVMVMLAVEPGCSGARIAEVVGVDKALVSRTVGALERRGLVMVENRQGNVYAITMTGAGAALYDAAHRVAREREGRLLGGLSPAERETLCDLLHRLLAATPDVANLLDEGALLHAPSHGAL